MRIARAALLLVACVAGAQLVAATGSSGGTTIYTPKTTTTVSGVNVLSNDYNLNKVNIDQYANAKAITTGWKSDATPTAQNVANVGASAGSADITLGRKLMTGSGSGGYTYNPTTTTALKNIDLLSNNYNLNKVNIDQYANAKAITTGYNSAATPTAANEANVGVSAGSLSVSGRKLMTGSGSSGGYTYTPKTTTTVSGVNVLSNDYNLNKVNVDQYANAKAITTGWNSVAAPTAANEANVGVSAGSLSVSGRKLMTGSSGGSVVYTPTTTTTLKNINVLSNNDNINKVNIDQYANAKAITTGWKSDATPTAANLANVGASAGSATISLGGGAAP